MVVDTSALVAILQNEPERRAFNEFIESAENCILSAASLVEVSIVIESRYGGDGIRTLDLGSGRQGHSLAGVSPAVPIARFRHVAMPQFLGVTPSPLRGVNGPAAWEEFPAVGTTGGSSKCGSMNIKK